MTSRVFFSPALSQTGARFLYGMLLVAAVGRIIVAFETQGVGPDIQAYHMVWAALQDDPLQVYSLTTSDVSRWPYPSGFIPWIALSGWVHNVTGLRFDGLIQLAPIAADLGLVWMVQAYLGQAGANERTRLAAAALVALGPSFATISGYHGQLDSLAILPPLFGLWYWQRGRPERRALVAGVLIGIGGAIKFPPLVILLALLPTARSIREGVTLAGTAAFIVLVALAPFLVSDFHGASEAIRANKGLPGFGGISLLLQPNLAAVWLGTDTSVEMSSLSEAVFDHSGLIVAFVTIITAAAAMLRRLEPIEAATLLYLAVYALGVNFAFQYLVAGLAVFLLAGRLKAVAAIQVAVLIPMLLLYVRERRDLALENVYVPIMLAVWAAFVAALIWQLRRPDRSADRARRRTLGR